MMDLVGVYGASGCGRSIMPILRMEGARSRFVFIDDAFSGQVVNGHVVVSWEGFLAIEAPRRAACLAIANPVIRKKLAMRCDQEGIPLCEARAASVVQMDDVVIGDGACLSPFVTLTSNIVIGRCFHANLYSYIEHDCRIGDFVTFAPGVKCNGNVIIEDSAYIGAGAMIRQGVPGKPLIIGRGATIGMGAVVTQSVPAGVTVVGNPARPLAT